LFVFRVAAQRSGKKSFAKLEGFPVSVQYADFPVGLFCPNG